MEVAGAGHTPSAPPPRTTRQERIILGVLVCVGFGIRVFAGTLQRMPEFDGTFYVNYFRVPGWQWVFPPGYPAVIELARLFTPDGVAAARLVSAFWGAALAIPIVLIARHYVSPLLAFAAGALAELNPLLIRQSAMAQSEMQYVALLLLMFLFFLRRRMFLSGVAAGLAYLTRPEALAVFGMLWLYDAVRNRRPRQLALMAAGLLVVSLPYVGYLRLSTGEWTLSPKTMNIRERGESLLQVLQMESLEYQAPSFEERVHDGIAHYPARALLYGGFLLKYAGIVACLLAVVGVAARSAPLVLGLTVLVILPLFGLKVEERFIVPYVPFIIVLAVVAANLARRPWMKGAVLVLMFAAVAPTVGFIIEPEDRGGMEFVEAGEAMRPLTSPGDLFLDRKPFVAFYAGGSFQNLPNDSVEAVLRYARKAGAKYIVLSERVLRLFRPQLLALAGNEGALDQLGLVTVYQKGLGTGYGVRIVSMGQ